MIPQPSVKLFFEAIVDSMRPNFNQQSNQGSSSEENHPFLRKGSIKSLKSQKPTIAPFKFDALEPPEDYSLTTRHQKARSSVVPVLENITAMLPYENTEITALGWNEYQEIKLILYSVNFRGKESITFPELKQRRGFSSRIPETRDRKLQIAAAALAVLDLCR